MTQLDLETPQARHGMKRMVVPLSNQKTQHKTPLNQPFEGA